MSARHKQKHLIILLILGLFFITGCATKGISSVPSDFFFIMDVKSAGAFEGCALHVNIEIDSKGKGRYETYDTGCAITYDPNHMVTHKRSQVVKSGNFKLSDAELERLWETINHNNFFELRDDYRMAMGFSYAFIMIEADGNRHTIDNIGMEVPEVRAIVEATDAILPEGVNLDYGEGHIP